MSYGLSDLLKGIHEKTLSPNKNTTLSFDYSIFLLEDDVIHDGENHHVLVSFDITNLRKDGQASEYWSEPIRISVPKGCRL